MARYTKSSCKRCRREGIKLYLKGDRCFKDKCGLEKRSYAPGQHGRRRMKVKEYGIQLREKQKVKRVYGVLEKQFRRYFNEADRRKGITGENLLMLLELRLDSVAFNLGYGSSRAQARQIVRHGHILVNNRCVSIPSYQLREGDVISVKEKTRKNEQLQTSIESMSGRGVPDWLELNSDKLEGRVLRLPKREDIKLPVQEQLIVELYSR